MSDVTLILGPIVFKRFELPSSISFGGRQRLAVHQLASGHRVIDVLGDEDADIKFNGTFAGPDAAARAIALDSLRISGAILPLTWGLFVYLVVIRDFSVTYCNDTWIPYSICCAVVQSPLAIAAEILTTIAAAALADLTAATATDPTQGGWDQITQNLMLPGATQAGSPDNVSAVTSVATQQAALDGQLQDTESSQSLSDATSLPITDRLGNALASTETMSAVAVSRGYLGRVQKGLAAVEP